jgi:ElaB/YqjD/DUF883 family membrane-anchored ribosome-binding protein
MKMDSNKLDQDIDNARRRIVAAQLAMAEKLETVEKQIGETVAGAQSAISDVLNNVKDTVSDTGNSVKRAFDLPYQTRRHPWLMFGSAVLVGYMLGGRGSKPRIGKRNGYESDADPYRHQLQQGASNRSAKPIQRGNWLASWRGRRRNRHCALGNC